VNSALTPDICVVVLTCNRRESLRRTLTQLCAWPEAVPVAVADNGSTDGTTEMLRADFPGVTHLRGDTNIGAAGRNRGAEWAATVARTPYVAFCDDDCWWGRGSLSRACALFDAHPRVGALTARVLVGESEREDPTSRVMAHSPLPSAGLPGRAILGLMAGATAFRTDAFRAAGGYEPRFFIGGEETVLALDLAAAGWQLLYAPVLVVHHWPSPLRDVRARRRLLERNAIWAAWLRLPVPMACRATAAALPRLWREHGIAGVIETLRAVPWITHERRVVPRPIARAFARVTGANTR